MSILLTILKIIGIVLLVLILLLLLLLLLVLFVPVRYQADIQIDGEADVKASISFLLHFVHLGAGFKEKQMYGKLRLLGIPIIDFFPSEEKKKKKEEQKRKKERRKRRNKGRVAFDEPQAGIRTLEGQPMNTASLGGQSSQGMLNDPDNSGANADDAGGHSGILKIMQKWKDFWGKLRLFLQKMIDKAKNIKYTINSVLEKVRHTRETVDWYAEVFQRNETKRALSKVTAQCRRLIASLKPQRLEGMLRFGFEDPGRTGDVFSKVCMAYPAYAGHMIVVPDFENRVIKGSLFIKGRIRIAVLVYIAWKIVFDKDIRRLYKVVTGGVKHE